MSTQRYEMYPLLMDELEKVVYNSAKENGMKINKRDRNHMDVLRFLFAQNPEMVGTLDASILSDEYNWMYESERNVIFPSGPEILTRLLDANVELSNSAPIIMPHAIFVLAVPSGFSYQGIEIPPLMVSSWDHAALDSRIRSFTRAVGVPDAQVNIHNWEGETRGIALTFRTGDKIKDVRMSFRANFSVADLPDILRCKTMDEYHSVLGSFKRSHFSVMDLDEHEARTQFTCVRLIAMLGMYSHAYPESLKSGYPGTEPKFLEPRLHKKWTKHSIRMPSAESVSHETKSTHYRSWHFRQLMDKRYYKGEHAHKPVGSRVVFVKDSMVGRKIEAETLDD